MAETHGSETDTILIARTLDGDREAFGILMRRHQHGLHRLVRGIVRSQEDSDDLVQEAFFRAYRYLDRFDRARPFRPWLYRIGLNLCFHHLRRMRQVRWRSLDEEDPVTGTTLADRLSDGSGDAAFEAPLESRRLREAMEELPPLHRSILILRAVHELRYEEIGVLLGVPVGTVMSRLSRAREALRRRLKAPGHGSAPIAPAENQGDRRQP